MAVADVASGLACGCFCPGCGSPLVARQGSRAWSFAHHGSKGNTGCLETAIHLAAKQALFDAGAIVVPGYTLAVSAQSTDDRVHRVERELAAERRIRFDRVALEVAFGEIRPDAVGYRGTRQLLVEIFVTHKVDRDKLTKLAELGMPALEIDLSDLPTASTALSMSMVASRVVERADGKAWLFYLGTEQALAEMNAELSELVHAAEAHAQARTAAAEARRLELERRRNARPIQQDAQPGRDLPQMKPAPALSENLLRPDLHTARLALPSHAWQALMYQRFVTQRNRLSDFAGEDLFTWASYSVGLINQPGRASIAVLRDYAEHLVRQGCLCVTARDGAGAMVRFQLPEESKPLLLAPVPWKSEGHRYDVTRDRGYGASHARPLRSIETMSPKDIVAGALYWTESWPRRSILYDRTSVLLARDPYRALLLPAIDQLGPLTCPATPALFIEQMEAAGVPAGETTKALRALCLAFA